MSKFKNKKALILAISAAMAGVGIIGVAAACAPSKAKKKPTEGTKPGQKGKAGSGGQGDQTGQNGSSSGVQNAVVVSLAQDTNLVKNENNYQLSLNVTNAENKFLEVELTEVVASGQTADKKTAKAQVASGKTTVSFKGLKANAKYKVSALKLFDSEDVAAQAKVLTVSDAITAKELSTEAPAPVVTESVVTLVQDAKLTKKDDKYELEFAVTNADNKFLEVELTKVKEGEAEAAKKSSKVKVVNGKVTVSFEGLEEGAKYKVSALKLFDSEDVAAQAKVLTVSDAITAKELSTEAIAPNNEKLQGDDPNAQTGKEVKPGVGDQLGKQEEGTPNSKPSEEGPTKQEDPSTEGKQEEGTPNSKPSEEGPTKQEDPSTEGKQEEGTPELKTIQQFEQTSVIRNNNEVILQIKTTKENYKKIENKPFNVRVEDPGKYLDDLTLSVTLGDKTSFTHIRREEGENVVFNVFL